MMGFGHMSGGGYSSSSNSNLSALAPPFTVERQNPNPYPSNPNLDYSASSYGIKPYGQQWDNYASPSAPVTEVPIDSTGFNTQLSVDDYPYKDSVSHSPLSGSFLGAFAGSSSGAKYVGGRYDHGAKVDPYYRPFVPPSAGEDDVSFWDEGSRRYLDGSGYGNNSHVELDGNFLSLKVNDGGQLNQHYQGGRTYEDKFGEDSGCLYQHNSDVPSGKVTAGPFSMGNIEDDSRIWKLSGFIPYESNGVNLAGSSSNYPRPRPSVPSIETTNSLSSYQSACGSYGNYHRKVDSPFTGLGSVARSFPSVVIRPPPAFDCNLPEDNNSHESALKDDAVGSNMRNFDNSSDSLLLNLGCDVKDNTLEAKLISDKFLSSSSGEKLQNQLRAEDTLDREIGGKSESKMSYMNASDGCLSACENITVAIKSNEAIDYQNTAVDSPCWRGAPPSQFSLFDVETSVPNPFSKILRGNYAEELENLNSVVHSETARSEKVESNGNGENGASGNSAMDALEQIRDVRNISGKYSCLLNDLKIGTRIKTSSLEKLSDEKTAGVILNHVPEGGAVAVHGSEEALFSPSSHENTECNNTSDPKLNVTVLLKAIRYLSEILRYHIAGIDAFSLDDDSSESLRRTISNLKACMSKQIAQDSNETHGDIPLLGNLGISVQPVHMANLSGGQATEHVRKYLPDEKRNDHSAINKDEKSSVVPPALDDLDVETDPATKAIHRILEDDFQIDEEMHPQALLYKNLWLESEAELCAVGYRARFDRMRLRMEKMKPDATQASIGLIPQVNASPDDSNGLPSRGLEARDITAAKSTKNPLNISTPSPPRGHADDVDASFMDRINTVRFWGKNVEVRTSESTKEGTNKELEPQLKASDGAQSVVMSSFDVLKSREDNFNSGSSGEKFQSKMIDVNEDDEPVNAVMARYNILKSRENNFKAEEKFQAKMGEDDYEEERTRPDAPRQRILKSRDEGSNVIGKVKTVNEDSARWPDASSSSDWEHVQKDEFSCNDY